MNNSRRDERIRQVARIIKENLMDGGSSNPARDAAEINAGSGWSYDVRWSDEEYLNDASYSYVEGDRLSEQDLQEAIALARTLQ